ncbi:MAG: ATP-binding cassette domain-containing protein [Vicinamibacteria bacterium]|nr:ATP-binding cassette domain-containing protein [Vicinamibacteria bacterium]
MTSAATAIVEFGGVSFAYAGRPHVLADVTLSIARGEVLALVGRSGAGKSTILKLINGLLLPTAGRVSVEGRDTRAWDGIGLRRRIGYVLQDVGLFPHMTVGDNVGVVPRLEGWPADRIGARVHELLDLVGLPAATFAARRPRELSGGQRQRIGLARALAVNPPLVLMDEPFGALDPVTRVELRREFTRIRTELGTTVVLVTHDMAEAFALGQRVGVIDDGVLVACDRPATIAASADPRVRRLVETLVRPPEQVDAR